MNNAILVLLALAGLIVLWGMTYYHILLHDMRVIQTIEGEFKKKLQDIHDKLPYLLEVLDEHKEFKKLKGEGLLKEREVLTDVGRELVDYRVHLRKVGELLTGIVNGAGKKTVSDTGYLEAKAELKDLFDDIKLLVKEYNEHASTFNAKLLKFPGNMVGTVGRMRSLKELE